MAATPAYDALAARHTRWHRLEHLQSLATWDRMTSMPAKGAPARAAAQAELAATLHGEQNDASIDGLLQRAAGEPLEGDQRLNLQRMQRQRLLATALPAELVARRHQLIGEAMPAWAAARAGNDWRAFERVLAPLVALVREEATCLARVLGVTRYDALLEQHEPGMRQARMAQLFDEVAAWLPGLLARALDRQRDHTVIDPVGPFPLVAQRALCERVMQLLGFDFDAGRLDTSAHPFTGGVPEDVRLTTKFADTGFLPALLATMHETGHARYQQNLPREWLGQPLAGPHSAALHEGQALSFERQLAPLPAFCATLAPLLREAFGAQPAFDPQNLQRLLIRVRPGRIRIEADELTYPAHVMLRVEIEAALVSGEIDVADVPAWWDERMRRLLGIDTRGDFARGPLQDAHWAQGLFGYFPAYLLGAMVAAQCFEALRQDTPDLDERVSAGDVGCVGEWLGQQVWRQGARHDLDAAMQVATGRPLGTAALQRHLARRYLGEG